MNQPLADRCVNFNSASSSVLPKRRSAVLLLPTTGQYVDLVMVYPYHQGAIPRSLAIQRSTAEIAASVWAAFTVIKWANSIPSVMLDVLAIIAIPVTVLVVPLASMIRLDINAAHVKTHRKSGGVVAAPELMAQELGCNRDFRRRQEP